MIFETPNPENLVVGSNYFYLDPTHRHPLPTELMEFLLKNRGFDEVEDPAAASLGKRARRGRRRTGQNASMVTFMDQWITPSWAGRLVHEDSHRDGPGPFHSWRR